jgi:hypothetical protein
MSQVIHIEHNNHSYFDHSHSSNYNSDTHGLNHNHTSRSEIDNDKQLKLSFSLKSFSWQLSFWAEMKYLLPPRAEIKYLPLLQKWFMVTRSDFDWCRLVTIPGTKNNRCGNQTRSQPAQKMEPIIGTDCLNGPVPKIDLECRLLMSSATINNVQSLMSAV